MFKMQITLKHHRCALGSLLWFILIVVVVLFSFALYCYFSIFDCKLLLVIEDCG